MGLYTIDEAMSRRIIAADAGDEDGDDLLAEIEDQGDEWWPERGDGKSWDVLHWALTGTRSGVGGRPARLFGAEPMTGYGVAEWSALLHADAVARVHRELQQVDEDTMRRRLAEVPPDVYWAEVFGQPGEHDEVVADAADLKAFVARCAQDHRALLITLS